MNRSVRHIIFDQGVSYKITAVTPAGHGCYCNFFGWGDCWAKPNAHGEANWSPFSGHELDHACTGGSSKVLWSHVGKYIHGFDESMTKWSCMIFKFICFIDAYRLPILYYIYIYLLLAPTKKKWNAMYWLTSNTVAMMHSSFISPCMDGSKLFKPHFPRSGRSCLQVG